MCNEDLYSLSDIKMKILERNGWARLGEIINAYSFGGKPPPPQGRESCRDVIVGVNVKLKMLYSGWLSPFLSHPLYCDEAR